MAVLMFVGAFAFTGCEEAAQEGERDDIEIVYVNWIEGIAMAHVKNAILQDSLGMEVGMNEVTGGGIAFSSVAGGGGDVMIEAWLPTTHAGPWEDHEGELVKVGEWYNETTVGWITPTYTDIHSVEDLADHRDALGGEILGIEEGAAINDQTREILDNNNIEGFDVVASSGPAAWSSLERAINREEPIVTVAWRPHWKWGRYDIRYIEGAQTGQSPVFGEPEDIFSVARPDFEEEFPDPVVEFFDNVYIEDEELDELMQPFRPESDVDDQMAAAREWIANNRDLVSTWMPDETEAVAAQQ